METDRFVLRSVTDEIMYAILDLSGQEYVDLYAATAKARIAAGQQVEGTGVGPGGAEPPSPPATPSVPREG
jgi:1-acyl-sn-glycerol-3-phosphate acyltransferase